MRCLCRHDRGYGTHVLDESKSMWLGEEGQARVEVVRLENAGADYALPRELLCIWPGRQTAISQSVHVSTTAAAAGLCRQRPARHERSLRRKDSCWFLSCHCSPKHELCDRLRKGLQAS